MNLRKIKKSIFAMLLEYNSEYNTNVTIDAIKYIDDPNDRSEAYFIKDEIYHNHKNILYIRDCLFDRDNFSIKAILFHEFTHLHDTKLFIDYPELQFAELMKIYSEIHASEIEMDTILSSQTKPYSLNKNVTFIQQIPLSKLLEFSLDNVKEVFTLPNERLTEINAPFNYEEVYYYIGKVRSIVKNEISYNIDYQKEFSSLNNPFPNLLIEIIDYCTNSDLKDYNKLILLQEKMTDTIVEYIKSNNEKFDS